MLLVGKVWRRGKLCHRLGNESEGSAQVVGYIGEKHQFGLYCVLKLFIQLLLLIPLLFKGLVLLKQDFLVLFVLPVCTQDEENHTEKEHDYRYAGVKQ